MKRLLAILGLMLVAASVANAQSTVKMFGLPPYTGAPTGAEKFWMALPGYTGCGNGPDCSITLNQIASYAGKAVASAPHVANLAALQAWAYTGTAVVRDGYNVAGDSGDPVTYYYNPLPCTLNSGAGDTGWQVQASIGGCWIAALPSSGADIRIWGAQTSTLSSPTPFDSSTAFASAYAAASAGQAGGTVIVPASYFLVAQTANLDLRAYPHVTVKCGAGTGIGVQPTGQSNFTAPCTLQVNPAYTILPGPNVEWSGPRVVNDTLDFATTVRQGQTVAYGMSGTAFTVTQNDQLFKSVQINGFAHAITTISPKNYTGSGSSQMYHVRLDDIQGDDLGLIAMGDCGDSCTIGHADAWNFLTVNAGSAQYIITSAQAYTDGSVELGVINEGTPLISGDTIEVFGMLDSGMPIGRYTVGVIVDSTHFTLAGTSFVGSYTPAPTGLTGTTNGTNVIAMTSTTGLNGQPVVKGQYVYGAGIASQVTVTAVVPNTSITISSAVSSSNNNTPLTFGNGAVAMPSGIRKGCAYEFTGTNIGGQHGGDLWEYGHDCSVHFGPAHGPIVLDFVWTDGPPYIYDATPIGIWNEGYGATINGGTLGINKATTVLNNATSPDSWLRPLTLSGVQLQASGCRAGIPDGSAITINAGSVSVVNSFFDPSCPNGKYPGYNEISVAAGGVLKITTSDFQNYIGSTSPITIGYPAPPVWQSGAHYTSASNVTGSDGGIFQAGGTCVAGSGPAPSGTSASRVSDGTGGCNWLYQGPTCTNVTIDGVSPLCTPPATTTPCIAGQLAWDNNFLYVCSPQSTWGEVVTGDVSSGQVTIIPPAAMPSGKSALVVKSNDGSSTGYGGGITLGDNLGSAVNATKQITVSATDGSLVIFNSNSSGIFKLTNEGSLSNINGVGSPFGLSLVASGTAVGAWTSGTAYTNASYASSNGNIYHVIGGACTAGGTGGTPVAPSGTGIVIDQTGGTGGCKWEYVSGVPTGNVEVHATAAGSLTLCAGNTTTQKGLVIQNGGIYPALCDGSGPTSGGTVLGSTADPFASLTTNAVNFASLADSSTAPTISSGFCTGANIAYQNGTVSFQVGVGASGCTGIQTGVIGLPTAAHGWKCNVSDIGGIGYKPDQVAYTTTSATIENFSRTTGASADWVATHSLIIDCHGF